MYVDLPLEDLYKYEGRNPRPADFDEYWASGLAELDATPLNVRMERAEWQVPMFECYDVWFDGVRGGQIYAKYVRPTACAAVLPAIVHFHGYTCDSEMWSYMVGLAAPGFAVFYMDCRYQAGKSYDNIGYKGRAHSGLLTRGVLDEDPQNLAYRHIMLDAAQMARVAMSTPGVDASRVAAYGQSQGGALTLACAALEPRVARAVPVFPYLCDYLRVYEMRLGVYDEIVYWLRTYDPQHKQADKLFEKLGHIDVQFLAPRIQAKIMLLMGLNDTSCPPSSQFAAYNKITAPKELVVFPDYCHETLRGQTDIVLPWLVKELM